MVETAEVDGAPVTTTTEYEYDAQGQLTKETVDGVVVNEMTYDKYGNILAKNGKQYTYGDTVWNDKLTAYDGYAFTYDAQGNPTVYKGHTLTWEKGRQLKQFGTNTYTHNANGIRTSKTVNGEKHTYFLEGTTILQERWGENTLESTLDNEGQLCGILNNKIPYFFLKNLQGDIIAITDSDGQVVARYTYDAWGKCTIVEDTTDFGLATINPYRYRGYYFDTETGLYYLQSRYYDPEIGRFINGDDAAYIGETGYGNHLCLYSYCMNDPVNLLDESGCFAIPWQVKVGLAAGVASAVWELGKYIVKNWTKKKTAWSYIKGLGAALVRGFVRGFVVGLLSTIRKSLVYGLLGGTMYLIYGLITGTVKNVGQGISAFMNGWTYGVFTKTLSNLLGNLKRYLGWKSKTKDTLEYILSTILGFGLTHYFKW